MNHLDSNQINIDSNRINLNHANLNQLIPADLITKNETDNIYALNQLLSWGRDSMVAADNRVFKITPLAYLPTIHTEHTPSLLYSLHL